MQTSTPSPLESWRPLVPQQRPLGRTEEDVDLVKLLDQIEGDVPRIPSAHGAKQQARPGNVFVPRFKRQKSNDSERRNKTRRTGQRRSNRTRQTTSSTRAPSHLSTDEIDEASFSCVGRVQGGFYADVDSGCRRFHICGLGKKNRFYH